MSGYDALVALLISIGLGTASVSAAPPAARALCVAAASTFALIKLVEISDAVGVDDE